MQVFKKHEFFKKSFDEDTFEVQVIEDLINNEPYKHEKIEDLYVEPTVKDVKTIEDEKNKENDDFLKVPSEFNKIDAAATRQKKSRLLRQVIWRRAGNQQQQTNNWQCS